MIVGAHVMLQSTNDKADQAFFTDVLKLPSVNVGGGFMIYGVPPAELAIHGSDTNGIHELFLMCDDIAAFTGHMTKRGIAFTTPSHQGWGTMTRISLPGGGQLGVYQPHHPRPPQAAPARKAAKKAPAKSRAARKPAKKAAKKKTAKKKRR